MKINPQQKNILKTLVKHDAYEILLLVMSQAIDEWQGQNIKAPDEFNTIYNLAKREGKVDGLKEFFTMVETEALSNE